MQRTFRCDPIQVSQWKRQLLDGASELLGLSASWIGATRALQLADPDGHQLQLLQG